MSGPDPASVATRYFDAIRSRDVDGIRAVFADDAVLVSAAGTVQGRDAIAEFYTGSAFQIDDLSPTPGEYVVDGERLAVEIDLFMGGRSHRVADFFEIRDGLVRRLVIYMMPTG
jgi:ketosteroid isomerase-like protein